MSNETSQGKLDVMTHKANEMRRVYLLWGISSSDVIYYTFH